MPTIKSFQIKDGKVIKGIKGLKENLKLPFKATGWKSDRNQDLVEKEREEKLDKIIEDKKEINNLEELEEKFVEFETEEYLKSLDFSELRKLAKEKYRVTGRSKKGLIKDILAVQSGEKEPEIK